MFDKQAFAKSYESSLKKLKTSERVTKEELLTLSRSVLEAVQSTEDVSYINRLLAVLTPVNKRVAILYFKALSGFMFDKDTGAFSKKDKKRYDAVMALAVKFLEDPLNNIWTWAERNVEVEQKPFTPEALKKQCESLLAKAGEAGFSQLQVIETIMEAGLSMDTLIALMAKIAGEPAIEGEEANKPA